MLPSSELSLIVTGMIKSAGWFRLRIAMSRTTCVTVFTYTRTKSYVNATQKGFVLVLYPGTAKTSVSTSFAVGATHLIFWNSSSLLKTINGYPILSEWLQIAYSTISSRTSNPNKPWTSPV